MRYSLALISIIILSAADGLANPATLSCRDNLAGGISKMNWIGISHTPQSMVGATLFVSSLFLKNVKSASQIVDEELAKRKMPYEQNPEFQKMIEAVNRMHGRSVIQANTQEARIIDPKSKPDYYEDSPDSQMFHRFIDIYNHPLSVFPNQLASLALILVGDIPYGFRFMSLKQRYTTLEKRGEQSQEVFKFIKNQESEELYYHMGLIGEIIDEYIKSNKFKQSVSIVSRGDLLPIVKQLPDRESNQRKTTMKDRELNIKYNIVFGLYPRLREHFSPLQAFQIALSSTGVFAHNESNEPRRILEIWSEIAGFNDSALQEILLSIKNAGATNLLPLNL